MCMLTSRQITRAVPRVDILILSNRQVPGLTPYNGIPCCPRCPHPHCRRGPSPHVRAHSPQGSLDFTVKIICVLPAPNSRIRILLDCGNDLDSADLITAVNFEGETLRFCRRARSSAEEFIRPMPDRTLLKIGDRIQNANTVIIH